MISPALHHAAAVIVLSARSCALHDPACKHPDTDPLPATYAILVAALILLAWLCYQVRIWRRRHRNVHNPDDQS